MSKLFEQYTLSSLRLRNRLIRSATHEGMGDAEGRPLPELEKLYLRLAEGGVGAIVAGYAAVQKDGRTTPNMRMFGDDSIIEDYQPITSKVRAAGAVIIQQIAHGGALVDPQVTGTAPVAPSAYKNLLLPHRVVALREEEIETIIESFVDAIERTQRAGFDGVQLHAAHLYLLAQFLSGHTNKRNDKWGGNTENRFRIIAEIVTRARERVGSYPILAKFSAHSNDKGGLALEEGIEVAERMEGCGIDAIEVSCGGFTDFVSTMRMPHAPVKEILELTPNMRDVPGWKRLLFKLLGPSLLKPVAPMFNYNVEAAEKIRRAVSVPVIVVGGIRRLEDMEEIISSGKADCISMCRPLIHSPTFPRDLEQGRQTESTCCNCGICLFTCIDAPLRCHNGRFPQREALAS